RFDVAERRRDSRYALAGRCASSPCSRGILGTVFSRAYDLRGGADSAELAVDDVGRRAAPGRVAVLAAYDHATWRFALAARPSYLSHDARSLDLSGACILQSRQRESSSCSALSLDRRSHGPVLARCDPAAHGPRRQ